LEETIHKRNLERGKQKIFSILGTYVLVTSRKEPNYLNVVNNFRNILFAKNGFLKN